MARFGQGFIQALINPSYQQGLFTAAQGPGIALGEASEKNKMAGMDELGLAQLAVQKAGTPQEKLIAMQNLTKVQQNIANRKVDPLIAQAELSNDPNEISQLRNQATNIFTDLNVPTAPIQGLFTDRSKEAMKTNAVAAGNNLVRVMRETEDPRVRESLEQTLIQTYGDAGLDTVSLRGLSNRITQEKRTANENDRAYLQKQGEDLLNPLIKLSAQATSANNLEALQNQINSIGEKFNLPFNDYGNLAVETYQNQQDINFQLVSTEEQKQESQRQAIEDNLFNLMRSQKVVKIPSILPGTNTPLDEKTKSNLQERIQNAAEKDASYNEAANGTPLDSVYLGIAQKLIKRENFETLYPGLETALKAEENTQGKSFASGRKSAINTIMKYVDAEAKRLRDERFSDESLQIKVNKAIDFVTSEKDRTIFGSTYHDFFEDYGLDTEERKLFNKQAILALKENPDLKLRDIVRLGMQGLENLVSDQQTQDARRAAREAVELSININRQIAIDQIMMEEGIANEVNAAKILDERLNAELAREQALIESYVP
jgi:hypothetical protein